MRHELTDSLKEALDLAQKAARGLNQEFVGTEHLMLGLLNAGECEASGVLARNHLDCTELQNALLKLLPHGEQSPVITGNLPLSPKAQRAINAGIVKAESLREAKISSRFLLLSLLDEPGSAIRQIIKQAGGDIDQLGRSLVEKPSDLEN